MLKKLFPNLAKLEPVKWLALPLALLWVFGIVIGFTDLLFGSRVIDL